MSELYELPDGWEWKKFSDTVEFFNKTVIINNDDEYNYIGLEHIESNTGKLIDFNTSNGLNIKSSKVLFGKGMVLYGKLRPYLNKVWKAEFSGIATTEILPFKPYSEKLDADFFAHYLRSDYFVKNAMNNISGARMPRITTKYLKNFAFIPLPPLQEQKRIVAKLDTLFEKIDRAIALHQKNMDEADTFMGSVLNDVFGELEEKYEKIDFNSVCVKITDGSHNPPKGIENSDFLMLSSKNIHNSSIHFDHPRYLKEEDFLRENKRTDVSIGDVLLTIVGTIGRTAVVDIDKKFTLQRSVAVLKPKKDLLDSYFLMYSLQKNLDILTQGAKGAAQKGIYLKSIKNLEIVNLPLHIQQKTVTYLDAISQKTEKLKQVQKEKMEHLTALKSSILDQAFKGKI